MLAFIGHTSVRSNAELSLRRSKCSFAFALLFVRHQAKSSELSNRRIVTYILRKPFEIDVGFKVNAVQILEAIELTNSVLGDLPSSLYRSLDYKTTSAIIGSVFCDGLASKVECIVNPIEKGHPDLIPREGINCSEEQLRKYPTGLEIKTTVGNIEVGANLRAGAPRVAKLEGMTWQAHHREVEELLGLIWDFVPSELAFNYPAITGVFYANDLTENDWGKISGTTGRNTKVTGLRASGKAKMGAGWVVLFENKQYLKTYSRLLHFKL